VLRLAAHGVADETLNDEHVVITRRIHGEDCC
jgi:hypothetical protein